MKSSAAFCAPAVLAPVPSPGKIRNTLGPAPLVQAFRRIFDTRDEETLARLEQMDDANAVWGCVNHFECTRVCPKEIPVTKSINRIKREIEKVLKKADK